MDQSGDKEERKREYNRLAQREFRRRRKEHLKNLEQAQKEQSSEQSEEIERLRYQNDELRRENESLRAQVYAVSSSSSSHHGGLMPASMNVPSMSGDGRSYSLSPSISGTSMSSANSPPASISSDLMPMASLSLTSSMLPPTMQAFTDPSALSSQQPYSMVHPSGLRHNSQSSPETSGFRSPRPTMGPPFQTLSVPNQSVDASRSRSTSRSNLMSMSPYDRRKARTDILDTFRPLISDPSIVASPETHLAVLRSMAENLPSVLKPLKVQLETPHYYGIDMIASPALRDRLMTVTPDVAQNFVTDAGIWRSESEDVGQLIIWGEDPFNEMSWEFSQPILERWGWLLGREWVERANFWRRQRGAPLLPDREGKGGYRIWLKQVIKSRVLYIIYIASNLTHLTPIRSKSHTTPPIIAQTMSTGAENLKANKSIAILDAAEKGKYGIVSVVCYNIEEIMATARAAEARKSPAMILLFPWALTTFKSHLVNFAADVCSSASVPISLHLDHCQDISLVKYAASLPFDSIMVDMSHHEKEENLRLTKELTEICHERGIATEAEPGRIEGGEDGLQDTADLEGVLTSAEQALEFVSTGIDFLAPAFGNVHGEYGSRGPKGWLEFDRLEKIREAVGGKAKLVLHGTNSFDRGLFMDCVEGGVSKINVNKQLVEPWKKMMDKRHEAGFLPITKLMEDSMEIFQAEVERLMDECGSTGKA
ncbi:hypothetical protein B7494_g2686 [Chlorociboria aeruginascens]|nr:hypothetical protein B7494_g2686 [Chlorociboria aeruginascens]